MMKEIHIPDIGGVDNVAVIEVHVAPGTEISEEDALITLESDKATMDVPSPQAGVVKELKIGLGDKVSEGDLILILEAAEATDQQAPTEAPKPQSVSEPVVQSEESSPQTAASSLNVTVPDIGGFNEVPIIEIYVKAGDEVSEEDPLIALESDKATMDIPAPQSGVVESIGVALGDKVSEGDSVLTLKIATAATPEVPAEAPTSEQTDSKSTTVPQAQATAPKPQPVATQTATKTVGAGQSGVHAGPAVRRMARILGVDLTRVKDTGPRGRVLKEDVEAYVREQMSERQAPANTGFQLPEMPKIDFSKFGDIETIPLNRIKKLTGANMHRNWVTVPHVTQFDEADITELEKFRKSQKLSAEEKGIKLTMVAFLLKAVAGALKAHPMFNTSLDETGENLIQKQYYHIGVAVDTPEGLVVPVIRNVDKKGLFECAEELMGVSEKARNMQLSPRDMQGSCFTISSLGGVGGTAFTPIVNAPDVAILGVSRAQMKPVYKNDEFVPRLMLPLSLSYDHRVIDGAAAARFTTTLGVLLADIRKLLL